MFLSLIESGDAAQTYIVFLRRNSIGVNQELDGDAMTATYNGVLASCMDSNEEKARESILYSYSSRFNGFAATLEDVEVEQLESVWPESPCFNDTGMGPIPSRWKGKCAVNGTSFKCNRKLIGARAFNSASPRDVNGHGTHTLSTAGGSFVRGANFLGSARGTAKGGSPGARVAAYKVCNDNGGCGSAEILAGFDAAIQDKVDVITVSLGSYVASAYFRDTIAIGAFHAVSSGIPVVCSAGNSGFDGSVSNVAPWILTVAASTLDRRFVSDVKLGNGKVYKGISFKSNTTPSKKFYPLINAVDAKAPGASEFNARYCNAGSLDPSKVKGKIVFCIRNGVDVQKSYVVEQAGGVGVVLASTSAAAVSPQAHFIPTSAISKVDGDAVLKYISNTSSPVAYISGYTEITKVAAPVMAGFSSRGPNRITPEILKPDVTAPGVYILAGYTEAKGPTGQSFDKRRIPYNVISGTSMSCPHVAGIVGLLKTLYPKWSPAAIRSSIVTTANTTNNKGQPIQMESGTKANQFNYGAGHVSPNKAASPGLVYELNVTDYLNFLCYSDYTPQQIAMFYNKPYTCPKKTDTSLSNLNYPSISVPNLSGKVTVTRTAKNVGTPGVYRVAVEAPAGIKVEVNPKVLSFSKVGEVKKYSVTLEAMGGAGSGYLFGGITWSDGKHRVRSPLVPCFPCASSSTLLMLLKRQSYIVFLRRNSIGVNQGLDGNAMSKTYNGVLASCMGSNKEKARESILYSYSSRFNGFAATLEDVEVEQLESHPEVIAVLPNEVYQIQTTSSWRFMGLENSDGVVPPESLWRKARFGGDVIIGNLDSGKCDVDDTSFKCNRKLIGARAFNGASPRDVGGHGTHTLSTAGGSFVPGANFFGSANGTAKGGSPGARVAAYKVCKDNGGCPSAEILAGFDAAIQDKVDVITVSLGSSASPYVRDSIAIGSFHAVSSGIPVICSAGNAGLDGSVNNVAPWILTVAASTLDRRFISNVKLGDGKVYSGRSFNSNTTPSNKRYCNAGSLDPSKVKGKIVFCIRNDTDVEKSYIVERAGGAGLVLATPSSADISPQAHFIPTSVLSKVNGDAVLRYISNTSSPVAYISGYTEITKVAAPLMARFSSRGPNRITPEILKPDVTAPGVYILAGYTEAKSPTGQSFDERRIPYNVISGTSMACPHVAGIVGLLKTLYPNWSPAAIQSAIMTTANATNNKGQPIQMESGTKANQFNYGAGHVSPNKAASPGLVYELNLTDYLNFLCYNDYTPQQIAIFYDKPYTCPQKTDTSLSNLNYPSISVPNLSGKVTVIRTAKNVGTPGVYTVAVEAPAGIKVEVNPKVLSFSKVGEVQKYSVSLEAMGDAGSGYLFGGITWSDGEHLVRSPLVVRKAANGLAESM
ncbi:Subtilisin-like protease SBT5.3 [Linum grandiflorum]